MPTTALRGSAAPIMQAMKYLVIVAFIAIIGSLGAALVFMMRGGQPDEADGPESPPRKNHMARALAFRVGFSILLFVVVLISYLMGWIQPTGVPLQR
jgi:amino acid transporter